MIAIEAEVALVLEGRRRPGFRLMACIAAGLHSRVDHVAGSLGIVAVVARRQRDRHEQPVLEARESSRCVGPLVVGMTGGAGVLPEALVKGNPGAAQRSAADGADPDLREPMTGDAAGGVDTAEGGVAAEARRFEVGEPKNGAGINVDDLDCIRRIDMSCEGRPMQLAIYGAEG